MLSNFWEEKMPFLHNAVPIIEAKAIPSNLFNKVSIMLTPMPDKAIIMKENTTHYFSPHWYKNLQQNIIKWNPKILSIIIYHDQEKFISDIQDWFKINQKK